MELISKEGKFIGSTEIDGVIVVALCSSMNKKSLDHLNMISMF
jgi:hypothetical protein